MCHIGPQDSSCVDIILHIMWPVTLAKCAGTEVPGFDGIRFLS